MIGISLAYLHGGTLAEAAERFFALQADLPLSACELHMEGIQFAAGSWHWDNSQVGSARQIRNKVSSLGVHLPYLDMNPISADPRIARFAAGNLEAAVARAAEIGADHVVFHARGRRSPGSSRDADLGCWRDVVRQMTEVAAGHGIAFCLENADDVRSMTEIREILAASPQTRLCLDVGHLFERVELSTTRERLAARFCDRLLPWTRMMGKGLPFFDLGGIDHMASLLRDRLHCVHVHNHNGRMAHQPLSEGKAPIGKLLSALAASGLPMILEADYRERSPDVVRKDIQALRKIVR